ncbi:MAG: hypothetical protein ACRDDZ_03100 [Marinifilaceae bacterium]
MNWRIFLFLSAVAFFNVTKVAAGVVVVDKTTNTGSVTEADGPYVLLRTEGRMHIIRVDNTGSLHLVEQAFQAGKSAIRISTQDGKYNFKVTLGNIIEPAVRYPQPRKLFVVSDLEGDFHDFVTNLKQAGIVNDSLRWSWRGNHLVILGDVLGKGKDIVPLCWYIYRLEQEAMEAGGKVHFILGDNESMVLRGVTSIIDDKYSRLSERLEMNYEELWGENSVLGKWIRSKNSIEIIGRDLYVHAGLSKTVVRSGMSIEQINVEIKGMLGLKPNHREWESNKAQLLFGAMGPLRYRGMAFSNKQHVPVTAADMRVMLRELDVFRVIVGNAGYEEITCRHNGQIVIVNGKCNVETKKNRDMGILISKGYSEVMTAKGQRKPLEFNQ